MTFSSTHFHVRAAEMRDFCSLITDFIYSNFRADNLLSAKDAIDSVNDTFGVIICRNSATSAFVKEKWSKNDLNMAVNVGVNVWQPLMEAYLLG